MAQGPDINSQINSHEIVLSTDRKAHTLATLSLSDISREGRTWSRVRFEIVRGMVHWSCYLRQKVTIQTTDICHLFYKWIFFVYKEGSHLDHASCGVFGEYLLVLLVASKYGLSGAQDLSRLRYQI